MLSILLITLFINTLQLCVGTLTFQEEYLGSYVPNFIDTEHGPQIIAPNSPYVAASGSNKLYFIDTRFEVNSARHIKEQIERATIPNPEEYISIDEVSATARLKNSITGETTFVFDPPYARVLFAKGMNRHNPELELPEHEPAGYWERTYDFGTTLTKRATFCYDDGCNTDNDYVNQSFGNCRVCHHYRVNNEYDVGLVNAIGICPKGICRIAVNTPEEDQETDASYYKRMDNMHWGVNES